ncbi:cobalamin biosynthesis protein [Streptomyces sp. NPDC059900]|uniref:cobalamin biosynthesis protein n=1 Tax=Streptomyces sp. NPDC059900 TaxID=3155816 RepID=UPI00342E1672
MADTEAAACGATPAVSLEQVAAVHEPAAGSGGRSAGLVVGVGAARGVPADEVLGLVRDTLRDAGLSPACVTALATVDAKADEPGIIAAAARLGVPVVTYAADELAGVDVPNPSYAPLAATGTPSVAEASALCGGGELLVPKRKSAPAGRAPMATCAVARHAPLVRGAARAPISSERNRQSNQGVPVTSPPALLIAGHGIRDEAGANAFRDFVGELARRDPGLPVAGGFTASSSSSPSPSPSLGDAVAELVDLGAERVAAVPLTLVPPGNAADGLYAALGGAQERHPGLAYSCGRPLGPHPSLLKVLARRVDEALGGPARTPGDRADVMVLLVGDGSTDPEANADVHRAARLLWEGRGYAGVETAFVSLAAPDVPSGLDRCVRLGASRIVVLPYFLFTGTLPERICQQTDGWAAAQPGIEVHPADVIGPAGELLDLVMERYREAAADGAPVPGSAAGTDHGSHAPAR